MNKKRFDIQIAALVTTEINDRLEDIAKSEMRAKSDIIREAVVEYLKKNGQENKKYA